MNAFSRRVVLAAGVMLLAASAYAYFRYQDRSEEGLRHRGSSAAGRSSSSVTATGTVNPVTTVQVGTYVSGPIKAIYVDFNSPVSRRASSSPRSIPPRSR